MRELIYRDEAIKAVYDKDIGMLTQWDIGRNAGIDYAIKQLEKLQPVQPERKTGRWILYDKRFPWSKDYKCSECGNYINLSGINGGRGDANYCPNCGAKMKGELDEQ